MRVTFSAATVQNLCVAQGPPEARRTENYRYLKKNLLFLVLVNPFIFFSSSFSFLLLLLFPPPPPSSILLLPLLFLQKSIHDRHTNYMLLLCIFCVFALKRLLVLRLVTERHTAWNGRDLYFFFIDLPSVLRRVQGKQNSNWSGGGGGRGELSPFIRKK